MVSLKIGAGIKGLLGSMWFGASGGVMALAVGH